MDKTIKERYSELTPYIVAKALFDNYSFEEGECEYGEFVFETSDRFEVTIEFEYTMRCETVYQHYGVWGEEPVVGTSYFSVDIMNVYVDDLVSEEEVPVPFGMDEFQKEINKFG